MKILTLMKIRRFFSILFCTHNQTTHKRDIGGDEMMQHYVQGSGLAKSEWICNNCKCSIYKSYRLNLHEK